MIGKEHINSEAIMHKKIIMANRSFGEESKA